MTPMALTREEVKHVAQLARIGLTDEEVTQLQEQLSHILDQFAILRRLETDHIPPTAQVVPLHDVMRPDLSRPSWSRAEILANAPRVEEGYFRVQAVLED